MKLALIGCGKSKAAYPRPAWSFYTGSLTVAARRDCEDRELPYWYVSALHVLIPRHRVLAPYDLRLSDLPADARTRWADQVLAQLDELLGGLNGHVVEIHAGGDYEAALVEPLRSAGAVVEVQPPGRLQLGERLAWYSHRSQARAAAPDPAAVAPFEVTELLAWEPQREQENDLPAAFGAFWRQPPVVTAQARVRWMPGAASVVQIDPTIHTAVLDVTGLRWPSTTPPSILRTYRWTWRSLCWSAPSPGSTIALHHAAQRVRARLSEGGREQRVVAQVTAELELELRDPPLLVGRQWDMVIKASSTDPMLNIEGRATELLVPGVGRVWVRENIEQRGDVASSGERWGWHGGRIPRSRQVLQLACPTWAWPALARAVHETDGHHRQVVIHPTWTPRNVRPEDPTNLL